MKATKELLVAALLAAASLGSAASIAPFENSRTGSKRERIAFLGDSITAFENHLRHLRWFMAKRYDVDSPYFLNCGTAGDAVPNGTIRIPYDLKTLNPDRVIVMFGMNDNAYSTWSGGASAGHATRLANYTNNLRALVDAIRTAIPGVRIDLMTPSPYDEYSTDLASSAYVGANSVGLRDFAAAVRTVAAEKELDVIELHEPMTAIEAANPTGLHYSGNDRIHPGNTGSRFMALTILSAAGELPGVELSTTAAEEIFAAESSGNGLLLAQKLVPIGTEAYDHIRGLVYPDQMVPDWGGTVDLADITSAADAVDAWCDAEIAKETPGSARAVRLANMKVEYRAHRTDVPAYQDALDTNTTAAIQAWLDERVVPSSVPAVPVLETIGYIHGKMYLVTTAATDFDSVEIQSKPSGADDDSWQTIFGWTKTSSWSYGKSGNNYSKTMYFADTRVFRIRAVNDLGASDWLTVATAIKATQGVSGTADGTCLRTAVANAFDGDIDTLFEPDYGSTDQWCGQKYATPRRIAGARIVPRRAMADRAAKIVVEAADDAAYTENVRQVGAFPTTIGANAHDKTYEVVFDEPVTARYIRLFKSPKILSLLDAEFIAADLPDSATPVVTASTVKGVLRVSVSWTNPATLAASGFRLERSVDGGAWTELVASTTALAYQDEAVAYDHTYAYRVTGVSAASYHVGETATGVSESVMVLEDLPDGPSVMYSGYMNGKYAVLLRPVTGFGRYTLQMRTAGGEWRAIADAASGEAPAYNGGKPARNTDRIVQQAVTFAGTAQFRLRATTTDGGSVTAWVALKEATAVRTVKGSFFASLDTPSAGSFSYVDDASINTFAEMQKGNWVGYDFGVATNIAAVRFMSRVDFLTRAGGVAYESSDDGETWTGHYQVPSVTAASDILKGVIEYHPDTAIRARYFRFRGASDWFDPNEIELVAAELVLTATASVQLAARVPTVTWNVPLAANATVVVQRADAAAAEPVWTDVSEPIGPNAPKTWTGEALAPGDYLYRIKATVGNPYYPSDVFHSAASAPVHVRGRTGAAIVVR